MAGTAIANVRDVIHAIVIASAVVMNTRIALTTRPGVKAVVPIASRASSPRERPTTPGPMRLRAPPNSRARNLSKLALRVRKRRRRVTRERSERGERGGRARRGRRRRGRGRGGDERAPGVPQSNEGSAAQDDADSTSPAAPREARAEGAYEASPQSPPPQAPRPEAQQSFELTPQRGELEPRREPAPDAAAQAKPAPESTPTAQAEPRTFTVWTSSPTPTGGSWGGAPGGTRQDD